MDIESEVISIKERNSRVELDKLWETSWTRKLFIFAATYAVAVVWLKLVGEEYPWQKSFVPAAGYLLSTLSLGFLRRQWQKRNK